MPFAFSERKSKWLFCFALCRSRVLVRMQIVLGGSVSYKRVNRRGSHAREALVFPAAATRPLAQEEQVEAEPGL